MLENKQRSEHLSSVMMMLITIERHSLKITVFLNKHQIITLSLFKHQS